MINMFQHASLFKKIIYNRWKPILEILRTYELCYLKEIAHHSKIRQNFLFNLTQDERIVIVKNLKKKSPKWIK